MSINNAKTHTTAPPPHTPSRKTGSNGNGIREGATQMTPTTPTTIRAPTDLRDRHTTTAQAETTTEAHTRERETETETQTETEAETETETDQRTADMGATEPPTTTQNARK